MDSRAILLRALETEKPHHVRLRSEAGFAAGVAAFFALVHLETIAVALASVALVAVAAGWPWEEIDACSRPRETSKNCAT
jgi:hypothetical protein